MMDSNSTTAKYPASSLYPLVTILMSRVNRSLYHTLTHAWSRLVQGQNFLLLISHFRTVPSMVPLTTCLPSALQLTDRTGTLSHNHLTMVIPVSTFDNITFPSLFPLATTMAFGDKAMVITSILFPKSQFCQSSPICAPLSRSHSRSEPSSEHVMMRRSPREVHNTSYPTEITSYRLARHDH
jgi:hypothetical protein